jgi:hypothetical protein
MRMRPVDTLATVSRGPSDHAVLPAPRPSPEFAGQRACEQVVRHPTRRVHGGRPPAAAPRSRALLRGHTATPTSRRPNTHGIGEITAADAETRMDQHDLQVRAPTRNMGAAPPSPRSPAAATVIAKHNSPTWDGDGPPRAPPAAQPGLQESDDAPDPARRGLDQAEVTHPAGYVPVADAPDGLCGCASARGVRPIFSRNRRTWTVTVDWSPIRQPTPLSSSSAR